VSLYDGGDIRYTSRGKVRLPEPPGMTQRSKSDGRLHRFTPGPNLEAAPVDSCHGRTGFRVGPLPSLRAVEDLILDLKKDFTIVIVTHSS
jgi:hypothetical protein